ncbi:MAG TPA: NfeD family protein [Oxalicibacterium sp.]|nr:NfeD family protein [Oxalicibacterium sp.]
MSNWMIWFAAASVLLVAEMATGTFYLLMIAIGAAVGGIAALSGMSGSGQCILAAVVAVVATGMLRRSRFGRTTSIDAAHDPDVNLDIGQKLEVREWHIVSGAPPRARVMYRGALWDVELAAGGDALAGSFVIKEVRGNCLIVANGGE